MKNTYIIVALLFFALASCKKEVEQKGTPVQDMAGEWWVQIYLNGELYDDDDSYYHIFTYNTASFDADKLWVDASEAWPFVSKATVNYGSLSFLESEPVTDDFYKKAYPANNFPLDTITITGGNVVKSVSKPTSGTITDSINIEFVSTIWEELDLDAGDRYSLRGYRRTGFQADDH